MARDTAGAKAFDFAQETTKQILTLSSAIVAVTVTFIASNLKTYPSATRTWLELGWLFYLVSIALGVATLMSLSGNLERPGDGKEPSIYSPGIRICAILQILTFLAALVCTVIFGSKAA